jgi:FKBP-type peptidyl-prolyl cis-trans isomerase FkpA
MHKFTLFLAVFGLFVAACKKDDLSPEEQLAKDKAALRAYIAEKGLTVDSTASGMYYVITVPGSGANPTVNSVVTVGYRGYFLDGDVFDQTTSGSPATFALAGLIPGWQEGIPLMKRTGRATLLLPSVLGYGTRGSGSIPANTPIIFDIELVDFQ